MLGLENVCKNVYGGGGGGRGTIPLLVNDSSFQNCLFSDVRSVPFMYTIYIYIYISRLVV